MKTIKTIVGPPGTGKTTRLSEEVGKLIARGANPQDIHMLSFTRAAARETAAKSGHMDLGRISTLHSLCFAHLKMHPGSMLGFKHMREFAQSIGVVMNTVQGDQMMGVQEGDRCMAMLQYARARMISPVQVYARIKHRPCSFKKFQVFCDSYRSFKDHRALWDFDDLLEQCLLNDDLPSIGHMVIDEAQDLSPLQWKVVDKFTQGTDTLTVAGDPDQALYEWGGAAPMHMVHITHDIEVLSQSYRVPRRIHIIASKVSSLMKERYEQSYSPRPINGAWYQYSDPSRINFDERDTMVLVRTNMHKNAFEEEMWRTATPYVTEGGKPSLFDSHIADAIRAIRAIRAGADIISGLYRALRRCATRTMGTLMDLAAAGGPSIAPYVKNAPIWRIVNRPRESFMAYYLERVDLDAKPNVRLSTIHASKGREAERVILYMSTTKRVQEGYTDFPDAELRCWYVGVTRSKQQLDMVWGQEPLLPWTEILDHSRYELSSVT
jgi:superfamily I DNA/RNA helicase